MSLVLVLLVLDSHADENDLQTDKKCFAFRLGQTRSRSSTTHGAIRRAGTSPCTRQASGECRLIAATSLRALD